MTEAKRVYLIDDDAEICRSLAMLFERDGWTTRTFAGAEPFLAALETLEPAVIVSDLRMPSVDGLELMAELHARGREDPVIIMTGHGQVRLAVAALKSGAVDFIEKPFAPDQLLATVRVVASSSRLESQYRLATLTRRELEVFAHLVEGDTNKRIAKALGISPRTVEVFRANLMAKLGAENLPHLVRIGIESGFAGHCARPLKE